MTDWTLRNMEGTAEKTRSRDPREWTLEGMQPDLNGVYEQSRGENPDDASRRIQIGEAAGVSPSKIPDDHVAPLFENLGRPNINDIVTEDTPVTTEFLKNPQHMIQAHDDVENLTTMENIYRGYRRMTQLGSRWIMNTTRRFWEEMAGLSRTVGENLVPWTIMPRESEALGDAFAWLPNKIADLAEVPEHDVRLELDAGGKPQWKSHGWAKEPESVLEAVGAEVINLPLVIADLTALGLRGRIPLRYVMGSKGAAGGYEESGEFGALMGGAEGFMFGTILEGLHHIPPWMRLKYLFDMPVPARAALGAAAFGLPTAAGGGSQQDIIAQTVLGAGFYTKETLLQGSQMFQASKLAKRNQKLATEFMTRVNKQNGLEYLFMDPKDVIELFPDPMQRATFFQEVKIDPVAFGEAAELRTPVPIETAALTISLGNYKNAPDIVNRLKVHPAQERIIEELSKPIEDAAALEAKHDYLFQSEIDIPREPIDFFMQQLQGAGYSKTAAKVYGALMEGHARWWSEATGRPVEEYFAERGFTIRRIPFKKFTEELEGRARHLDKDGFEAYDPVRFRTEVDPTTRAGKEMVEPVPESKISEPGQGPASEIYFEPDPLPPSASKDVHYATRVDTDRPLGSGLRKASATVTRGFGTGKATDILYTSRDFSKFGSAEHDATSFEAMKGVVKPVTPAEEKVFMAGFGSNKLEGQPLIQLSAGCHRNGAILSAINDGIIPRATMKDMVACHGSCYKNFDQGAQGGGNPFTRWLVYARGSGKSFFGKAARGHQKDMVGFIQRHLGMKLRLKDLQKQGKKAYSEPFQAVRDRWASMSVEEKARVWQALQAEHPQMYSEWVPQEVQGVRVVHPDQVKDRIDSMSRKRFMDIVNAPADYIRGNQQGDWLMELVHEGKNGRTAWENYAEGMLSRWESETGRPRAEFPKKLSVVTAGWYADIPMLTLKRIAAKYGDHILVQVTGPIDFQGGEAALRLQGFKKLHDAGLSPVMRLVTDEFRMGGRQLNDPRSVEMTVDFLLNNRIRPNQILETPVHFDSARLANSRVTAADQSRIDRFITRGMTAAEAFRTVMGKKLESLTRGVQELFDVPLEEAERMARRVLERNTIFHREDKRLPAELEKIGHNEVGLTYDYLRKIGIPEEKVQELKRLGYFYKFSRAGETQEGVFPNRCCTTGKCLTCDSQCSAKYLDAIKEGRREDAAEILQTLKPGDAANLIDKGLNILEQMPLQGPLFQEPWKKFTPEGRPKITDDDILYLSQSWRSPKKFKEEEFILRAVLGNLRRATGKKAPYKMGTGKTALSRGLMEGYPLEDIFHFYITAEAPANKKHTWAEKYKDATDKDLWQRIEMEDFDYMNRAWDRIREDARYEYWQSTKRKKTLYQEGFIEPETVTSVDGTRWFRQPDGSYEGPMGDTFDSFRQLALSGVLPPGFMDSLLGRSVPPATPWYSQMESHLSEKLPDAGSAKQLLQTLDSWAKKGQIKAEELEWSGLREWLADQKGKVTKEQVLRYLAQNSVRIEEKELRHDFLREWKRGDAGVDYLYDPNYGGFIVTEQNGVYITRDKRNDVRVFETEAKAREVAKEVAEMYDENYGLGVPETRFHRGAYELDIETEMPGERHDYREFLLKLPTKATAGQEPYRDPHFGEENLMAHVRFNTRFGPNGEKILFIEELQDQWAQTGRREGFKKDNRFEAELRDPNNWELVEEFSGAVWKDDPTLMQYLWRHKPSGLEVDFEATKGHADDAYYKNWNVQGEKFQKDITDYIRQEDIPGLVDATTGDKPVPDRPFKKSNQWALLALKRMVRFAAENGYDSIAWTPGAVQADRYNLAKQIDEIRYSKTTNVKGEQFLIGVFKNGEQIATEMKSEKELPDFVGKDVAEKIIKGEGKDVGPEEKFPTSKSLGGVDLEVGGEGMKGFYDRMLPNIANKFFNKKDWGKARVGTTRIETGEPEPGREVWNLPITPKMKEKAVTEGMPLFQGQKKGATQFLNDRTVISFFEAKDLSTAPHELFHVFLDDMAQLAAMPDANVQLKKDWTTVLDFLGAEEGKPFTRAQHEKFARAGEVYLAEGVAPTPALQRAFNRLRKWFLTIYRSIKNLDVKLTDDMRRVFDRMLATEAEIDAARDFMELKPYWEKPDQVMGNREWSRYKGLLEKSKVSAASAIRDRRIREHARLIKKWKKQGAAAADKSHEVKFLKELRDLGGIKKSAWEDVFGKDVVVAIKIQHPGLVFAKKGLSPSDMVERFGLRNSEEGLEMLVTARNREQIINDHVREMSRQHDQGFAADEAVLSKVYEQLLQKEAEVLSRLAQRGLPPLTAAQTKQIVRRRMGMMSVDQMNKIELTERDALKAQMQTAARASKQAYAAGNMEGALKEKHRQMAIIAKMRERTKLRQETLKMRNRLKRAVKSVNRKKPTVAWEYAEQIRALMERFDAGIATKPIRAEELPTLRNFIEDKQSMLMEMEAVIPEWLKDPIGYGKVNKLTIDQLRDLDRTVQALVHMGRMQDKLIDTVRKERVSEAIDEMTESIEANKKPVETDQKTWRVFEEDPKTGEVVVKEYPFIPERRRGRLQSFRETYGAAALIKPEFILREADGGKEMGVFWDYLFRSLVNSERRELEVWEDVGKRLDKAVNAFSLETRRKWAKREILIEGMPQPLSKEQMIMIALNSGNEGNLKALEGGWGYNREGIQNVLNKLNQKEWAFVKSVWRLYERVFPHLDKTQMDLTGTKLTRVEPTTVQTPYGEVEGGYFPLVFDPVASEYAGALRQQAAETNYFESTWRKPVTERGMTIARIGGKMPPKLELSVIFRTLQESIHHATHAVAIRDADRIIQDKRFKTMFKQYMGKEKYSQLRPWLQHIARPQTEYVDWWDRTMNWVRNNTTSAILGLKASVAAKQIGSYTQTIDAVGFRHAMEAAKIFYAHPRKYAAFVTSKSTAVRNRRRRWDREVSDMLREFDPVAQGIKIKVGDKYLGKAELNDAFFSWITTMDKAATYPTWLAGYRKGMEDFNGNEARAIDYADMVVRTTQPTASPKDLSGWQRGSVAKKILTPFYTFFSVAVNRQLEGMRLWRQGKITTGEALQKLIWLVMVPAMYNAWVNKGFGLPDEETFTPKGMTNLTAQGFHGMIDMTAGGFPIIRDVAQPLASKLFTDQYFQYEGPPATGAIAAPIEAGVKAIDVAGKAIGPERISDKDYRLLLKKSVEATGYYTGLPAASINTFIDGTYQLYRGETKNPAVLFFRQRKEERGR